MEKLKLSFLAIQLLKHVIATDGKKETNEQGQEVPSARRLNGVESAQRRHFNKAIEKPVGEHDAKIKEVVDGYNELRKNKVEQLKKRNKKKKDEKDDVYEGRINKLMQEDKDVTDRFKEINKIGDEMNKEVVEIELTQETLDVLKKYFTAYGEEVGFGIGDDEYVVEIVELLK